MDDSGINKERMLLATERMMDFQDLVERWPSLKWEDVERIVLVGVSNAAEQQRMLAAMVKEQGRGVPAPSGIRNFREELMLAVAATFRSVDRMGISALGAMVFKPRIAPEWDDYRPSILIDNFFEGQFGRIGGNPRMGKTALACYMIELWLLTSPTNEAFGNIVIKDPPARYTYVRNCRQLLLGIANMPEGSLGLFFLDEGAVAGFAKQDAATRRAKDVSRLLRVIGKLHFSMVYIDQVVEAVPTIIQTFSTCRYFCHAPGVVSIDLDGPKKWFHTKVRQIPLTKLKFDSRDLTKFNVADVALDALFETLGGATDPKEAIRSLLAD